MKKSELFKMLQQTWLRFGLRGERLWCDLISTNCCESVWAELLGKISQMKPTENKTQQGCLLGFWT